MAAEKATAVADVWGLATDIERAAKSREPLREGLPASKEEEASLTRETNQGTVLRFAKTGPGTSAMIRVQRQDSPLVQSEEAALERQWLCTTIRQKYVWDGHSHLRLHRRASSQTALAGDFLRYGLCGTFCDGHKKRRQLERLEGQPHTSLSSLTAPSHFGDTGTVPERSTSRVRVQQAVHPLICTLTHCSPQVIPHRHTRSLPVPPGIEQPLLKD